LGADAHEGGIGLFVMLEGKIQERDNAVKVLNVLVWSEAEQDDIMHELAAPAN
jgi:hypothetical protein